AGIASPLNLRKLFQVLHAFRTQVRVYSAAPRTRARRGGRVSGFWSPVDSTGVLTPQIPNASAGPDPTPVGAPAFACANPGDSTPVYVSPQSRRNKLLRARSLLAIHTRPWRPMKCGGIRRPGKGRADKLTPLCLSHIGRGPGCACGAHACPTQEGLALSCVEGPTRRRFQVAQACPERSRRALLPVQTLSTHLGRH